MVEKKTIAVVAAGASAGMAQLFILREYVDKEYGLIPGLDRLGGFGTYSAIVGIVGGGITTALGLISVFTGKIITNETIQAGLLGYGIPALSGGVLSGLFPHSAVPGLTLRAPAKAPAKAPASQITLRAAGSPGSQTVQTARAPAASQSGAIPLRT